VIVIECTTCQARYQYDEERFDRKPSKKIKCAKCGTVFEIQNPAYVKAPAVPADAIENTYTSRPSPKPAQTQDTTAQSQLPKDDERSTGKLNAEPELPAGKRLSLAMIAGPDAGGVYRVEKPRVTIGRSGADLTLNDSEASRLHAVVVVRDNLILLDDLQSTNGTLVDGAKITGSVELTNHSEFVVGATTLMLIVTDEG
jgi:pSer/pThr/pTyr-binding forkhead associated (FHA) protein